MRERPQKANNLRCEGEPEGRHTLAQNVYEKLKKRRSAEKEAPQPRLKAVTDVGDLGRNFLFHSTSEGKNREFTRKGLIRVPPGGKISGGMQEGW